MLEVGIGCQPQDLLRLRIYRVYVTLITEPQQVFNDIVAPLPRCPGGADDSDTPGLKKGPQAIYVAVIPHSISIPLYVFIIIRNWAAVGAYTITGIIHVTVYFVKYFLQVAWLRS